MKAAKLTNRPEFTLMKQSDIQNIYHMQMPRWLFSDPRYCDMSLEAKVTYTFLLNRFQLSRRNAWVNEHGEVFVIFPRKSLAKELRICEQRVTSAFKTLVKLSLIWEKRCGRGEANQIYLATVNSTESSDYECTPFVAPDSEENSIRNSDFELLDESKPQFSGVKNGEIKDFTTTKSDVQEPQNLRSSYKEINKTKGSYTEVSHSSLREVDEEKELLEVLERCELQSFAHETAVVFENAIERIFYSESVRLGSANLPKSRLRRKLKLLDEMILREAERKLANNFEQNIRNSTAYTMVTILNCIAESESDLMVDPYLNALRAPPSGG